ncbi:MAG TPA: molybdate ABC transporter substrate-binding protein [Syntrophales bacterium]|nr:molybdate ABC transporter substrate-binding protein [Syntrophobacterales bacterium]HQL89943.1 molybdate ABC transporter substrate-binding protein [Syntrophales bacterium]
MMNTTRFRIFSRRTLPPLHRAVVICAAALVILCPVPSDAAESLKAAVAANFMIPFKEIAAAFEAETKIRVEPTYSSTGNFYGQIVNGAPYDVFLSADVKTPLSLFEKGLVENPILYATGRVVLWGSGKDFCGAKTWQEATTRKGVKKIAIANPVTAPYGAAAETALKKAGLWDEIRDRIVVAQNVGQSFQYAMSGGTDGSFCALSSALSEQGGKGCHFVIDEAPPIPQAACVLTRTAARSDASRLLKYLDSPKALEIKKRYGYF